MATDAELTKIVRSLNAVRLNGQAAAGADRAKVDGRNAVVRAAGVRTEVIENASRAVTLAVAQVEREDDSVGGDKLSPVGRSWESLRKSIQRVYIEIAGLEAALAVTGGAAAAAGAVALAMGESAEWWVKYGEELSKTTNLIERAGKVLGDAAKATTKAATNVVAPALEGASGALWAILKSAWPLLAIAGVLVIGAVAVNAYARRAT